MFKKILCPVDFSAHAHDALKISVELALSCDSELSVINVAEPVPVSIGGVGMASVNPQIFNVAEYQKNMEDAAFEQLQKLCQEMIPDSVNSNIHILVGHAGENVVEFAGQQSVELIVLSTHGRTGLKRLLLGSTAEYIIRHASMPVLSVRIKE